MSSKPLLYDVYSGAGGGARGYQRAGFEVWGVDIRDQPQYVGERFIQMDALEFIKRVLAGEYPLPAAWHASPPCQAFTQMSARYRGYGGKADGHPDLLTPTRALFSTLRQPWVIENVPGAVRHMTTTVTLHGGLFGLGVHRPRHFESNVLLLAPAGRRTVEPIGVYGVRPDGRTPRYRNNGNWRPGRPVKKSLIRAAKSIEEAREAMQIDWMDWGEIKEAIPPAYCEYIGRQLIAALSQEMPYAI